MKKIIVFLCTVVFASLLFFNSASAATQRLLKDCVVTLEYKSVTYTGSAMKPTVKLTYNGTKVREEQYTVKYSNNRNVGQATITITPAAGSRYTGKIVKHFKILPKGSYFKASELPSEQSVLLTYKTRSTVSGYQIQYSLSSSIGKNAPMVTIKNAETDHKKIKNLAPGKTYFFRIRTYKVVDGKEYYSEWSETRKVIRRRLIVGDSRTVFIQQYAAIESYDKIIALGAQYFTWFRDVAVPQIRSTLRSQKNYNVIINMGINDCANNAIGWRAYFVYDYIAVVQQLMREFPDTHFYFATLPYIRNPGYNNGTRIIPKEQVNAYAYQFNMAIKNSGIPYIDLYKYSESAECAYHTWDGVHQDAPTSQRFYNFYKKFG